jgi:hypothetical protein
MLDGVKSTIERKLRGKKKATHLRKMMIESQGVLPRENIWWLSPAASLSPK